MLEYITLEQAVELVRENCSRLLEKERKPVREAGGRILAEDVYSELDNPPFPRSPVDGYAVRAEDLKGADREHPAKLKVCGCIYAGEDGQSRKIGKGQAMRIMTGAPFPEGSDTAVKQEDTDYGEDMVSVYREQKAFDNYCFQGEDYRRGERILSGGTCLTFAEQGILSGLGHTHISVYKKPVIYVFTTGDELCPPGTALRPGKIYDSNGTMVSARLKELGVEPYAVSHIADNEDAMAETLREACRHGDVIVTTGAVSVGKKDIMHQALELLGAEKIFWRVALQPGTPTIFSVYEGTPILSLSGNPFGAMANVELLLRPMLSKMTGDDRLEMERRRGIFEDTFPKKSRMRRFVRAIFRDGKVSLPRGIFSSGAMGTLRGCNCLLDIPPGSHPLEKGEQVTVWML